MFAAEEIDVLRLVRIAIGPLALGTLPKGAARPLTASEKEALDASVHSSAKAKLQPKTPFSNPA
jgi:16S rRNA U516 pseudouridylate synthase RsuA-like enzyme